MVPKLVSTVFMCTGTLLSSPPGQIMKRVQFLREKHHHNKRTGKQTNKSSCNILISWELASQMRSEEHFFSDWTLRASAGPVKVELDFFHARWSCRI